LKQEYVIENRGFGGLRNQLIKSVRT